MNEALLREWIQGMLIENDVSLDKKVSAAVVFRRAIGMAIANNSKGDFEFMPPTSGPTSTSGIRLNPVAEPLPSGKDPRKSMSDAIKLAGLGDSQEIDPGLQGSKSGKFPTYPIVVKASWFDSNDGYIKNAISDANISANRKKYLISDINPTSKTATGKLKKPATRPSAVNVVLRAKSLESRLFTGQGLGELAEYAVAAAVNGDIQGEFEKAISGAVLQPSWKNTNGPGSEPNSPMASKFRDSYDIMTSKAVENMRNAASKQRTDPSDLFGSSASVQGGGGGLVDVVTDKADIHIKYDDPSRLSGNQQSGESKKHPVTDMNSLIIKMEQLDLGKADAYWKQMRDWFKDFAGITTKKDKVPLMNLGFYEWLLDGTVTPRLQKELSQNEELKKWVSSQQPNIEAPLLLDIQKAVAGEAGKNTFYFTFFPNAEGSYRLKIEELGSGQGPVSSNLNIRIKMNPNYKGLGGGSIGTPYVAVDADTGETYVDLEFRAKDAAKPIQLHRSQNYSSSAEKNEKSMSLILVNEILRRTIRSLLNEELTKTDKKEIERIAKTQAKKEIEKVVGKNLSKTIEKEVQKTLKGKATKQEIADISKSVIKKLYKQLSFNTPQIVDRIKV